MNPTVGGGEDRANRGSREGRRCERRRSKDGDEAASISGSSSAAPPAAALTLRFRLESIRRAAEAFVQPWIREKDRREFCGSWPVFANERCGCWYHHRPTTTTGTTATNRQHNRQRKPPSSSCCFRSVDGHVGVYDFSLKRLNRHVVRAVVASSASASFTGGGGGGGGCFVVDASRRKVMPDSFSRTVPIWAAVLNRLILSSLLQQNGIISDVRRRRFLELHTPPGVVSQEERETISRLIGDRVERVVKSGIRLDFLRGIDMPLRPVWVTASAAPAAPNCCDDDLFWKSLRELSESYHVVVCLSCPTGYADDEESWVPVKGFTPSVFWKNHEEILKTATTNNHHDGSDDDGDDHDDNDDAAIIATIQRLVTQEEEDSLSTKGDGGATADELGTTGIYVGSRRMGRPPECWEKFDAVLNVTTQEYDELKDGGSGSGNSIPDDKHYLQLPVEEGKRDKTELERWLAVGIVFVMVHAARGKRVLIHCAQGKDRSVAVAIAVVVLFCEEEQQLSPSSVDGGSVLSLKIGATESMLSFVDSLSIAEDALRRDDVLLSSTGDGESTTSNGANSAESGLKEAHVRQLIGRPGRDKLLRWVRRSRDGAAEAGENERPPDPDDGGGNEHDRSALLPPQPPLAEKDSIRLALHSVQKYREKSSPSRSTLQKVNRFFMSGPFEEGKKLPP